MQVTLSELVCNVPTGPLNYATHGAVLDDSRGVDRPGQECQKIFKCQLSMDHDIVRTKVCRV